MSIQEMGPDYPDTDARMVDRARLGAIVTGCLVVEQRRPFLPGVTSEVFFGEGKPVLGARFRGPLEGGPLSYCARRIVEVEQSRSLAIVVMTNGRLSPWSRAGIRCEFVPYGAADETFLEQDIVDLWGIDMVMEYGEVLRIG